VSRGIAGGHELIFFFFFFFRFAIRDEVDCAGWLVGVGEAVEKLDRILPDMSRTRICVNDFSIVCHGTNTYEYLCFARQIYVLPAQKNAEENQSIINWISPTYSSSQLTPIWNELTRPSLRKFLVRFFFCFSIASF
jgi:hypothetical protein